MAFEVLSVNQTSTYSVDDSDTVTLMGGVTLTTASDGFDASGSGDSGMDSSRLNILGTVVTGGIGVDFFFSPITAVNDVTVFIGATGEVHASGDGIIMDTGADNSIINNGLVTFGGFGLYFRSGTDNLIENHGQLLAVSSSPATPNAAVFLGIGGSSSLVNTGLISGGTTDGLVWNFGATSSIFNSGDMIATFGDVFNDGGSGNDTFTNQGLVRGDINLGGGNDIFNGLGGTVFGTISGGTGDDTFIIDDATIDLSENALQGTDTVQSSIGWKLGANFENLTLIGDGNIRGIGNDEANIIIGNDADNRLRGRAGNDTLNGGDGNDGIRGGTGNDVLLGGAGDDILRGNTSRDTLNGGDGHDRLIGGKGKDKMTGGEGEDVFVFNRVNHSIPGRDFDKVTDFSAGVDRIDFSGLNMELSFIGTAAFTNTAGEVRLGVTATKTSVRVDTDGDGVADMRIELNGASGLEASDFIL